MSSSRPAASTEPGKVRIFAQIALRTACAGHVTVLLFTLVATWNNYFLPLIMLHESDSRTRSRSG